jgi:AcrR family transcriptional regulator
MTAPRIRRDEVRRRLLDAAAQVFADRGFAGASLDEIARTAGFTKGAVYSNFSGKNALLAGLVERHGRSQLAGTARDLRARPCSDPALDGVAAAFARTIVDQDTWSRLVVEVAQRAVHDDEVRGAYAPVRQALRAELAAALAEACGREGVELAVPADQLALALAALRAGLAMEHGADPDEVDLAAVTAVVSHTLRGAVRRPAERGDAA